MLQNSEEKCEKVIKRKRKQSLLSRIKEGGWFTKDVWYSIVASEAGGDGGNNGVDGDTGSKGATGNKGSDGSNGSTYA